MIHWKFVFVGLDLALRIMGVYGDVCYPDTNHNGREGYVCYVPNDFKSEVGGGGKW